jgi:DNA-binding IclR family transcriptional regulator
VNRILSSFDADTPTLSVSELARRAALPIATAHRLVDELVGLGYLERTAGRRVRVGLRLWELGSRGSRTLSLRQAAMPFMEDLHAVVGHHTQLAVLDGLEALYLERLSARGGSANIIRIAGRLPGHACSSGLVLLAHAPQATQEELLASPLERFTERTVTDPRELRRLLADIRRQGFVVADGHITEGATGVAVPIRDARDRVVAALNVVVPSGEGRAPAQVSALLAAARGISRAMGEPKPSH